MTTGQRRSTAVVLLIPIHARMPHLTGMRMHALAELFPSVRQPLLREGIGGLHVNSRLIPILRLTDRRLPNRGER